MRTERTKTISDADGEPHDYACYQHGARAGMRLAAKLMGIVSGPLGTLAGSGGKGTVDVEKLGPALRDMAQGIVENGSDKLLDQLFEHTTRDGDKVPVVFDRVYQGNYGELVEAVVFVVMTNFESSFKRVPFVAAQVAKTRE